MNLTRSDGNFISMELKSNVSGHADTSYHTAPQHNTLLPHCMCRTFSVGKHRSQFSLRPNAPSIFHIISLRQNPLPKFRRTSPKSPFPTNLI